MKPQSDWWLEPVPREHISCWSTTSAVEHTTLTQQVRDIVHTLTTDIQSRQLILCSSSTYLVMCSHYYSDIHIYLYIKRDFLCNFPFRRWEGEGSCHPAGLPPPADAPVNPSWTSCTPSSWSQAHPGTRGRPQVTAGLSADSSAPQWGHDHCCLLKSPGTNDLCPLIHIKV